MPDIGHNTPTNLTFSSMSSTDLEVQSNSSELDLLEETDKGKGKQSPVAIHWVFTWNNYPDNWFEILSSMNSKIGGYVYGKEIGEQEKTPHIQGYVRFFKKQRPSSLPWPDNVFSGMRWFRFGKKYNPTKANISEQIWYCRKERESVSKGVPEEVRTLKISQMYDWQKSLLKRIEIEPDDKTVVWFWDEKGEIGKTQICKYLVHWHGALLTGGRDIDMKYQVCQAGLKGEYPKIVLVYVYRDDMDKVSYTGLEAVKDGLFASSKFECGMCCFNSPHVFVFANCPPRSSALSGYKWEVVDLSNSFARPGKHLTYGSVPSGGLINGIRQEVTDWFDELD